MPRGHGVDRAAGIHRRLTAIGRDLVVHERVIGAPVPQRDDDVALDAFRPRRRRRHFASCNAIGPVRKYFQRWLFALRLEHRVHRGPAHAGAEAPLPCVVSSRQLRLRLEHVIEAARQLVAELMAEVAVGLQRVDPMVLRQHVRSRAVAVRTGAGEQALVGRLQHRQPIVGRIDLRRFLRRLGRVDAKRDGGGGRLQRDRLRVDEAVAAHPDAITRGRQIRDDEPSAIVGHDDLDVVRREILRLGDDPHAGLRSGRALHDAADRAVRRRLRAERHRDRDQYRHGETPDTHSHSDLSFVTASSASAAAASTS